MHHGVCENQISPGDSLLHRHPYIKPRPCVRRPRRGNSRSAQGDCANCLPLAKDLVEHTGLGNDFIGKPVTYEEYTGPSRPALIRPNEPACNANARFRLILNPFDTRLASRIGGESTLVKGGRFRMQRPRSNGLKLLWRTCTGNLPKGSQLAQVVNPRRPCSKQAETYEDRTDENEAL